MSRKEYCALTLNEWYWRVDGYGRRDVSDWRKWREFMTLMYNLNVSKPSDRKKPHQLFPLPGDEQVKESHEFDQKIKARIRKRIEEKRKANVSKSRVTSQVRSGPDQV